MIRIAALGDSVTVGLGDSVPGRGWAGFLAEALAPAELSNLAVCGARVADVVRGQLPRALALRPSVATVLVGVNDTLRGDFAPPHRGRRRRQERRGLPRHGAVRRRRAPDRPARPGRQLPRPAPPRHRRLHRRRRRGRRRQHRAAIGQVGRQAGHRRGAQEARAHRSGRDPAQRDDHPRLPGLPHGDLRGDGGEGGRDLRRGAMRRAVRRCDP
ncbi:SGNH/GDSL hydrolase family protein [Nonomuraea sp. SYSU D8015]|uniref:SGNH/GDSL hydrolase family protein n=1 Tax=Nonomuraea sp. SYSU D8015 TaxID=2593644 RepID=UPI0016606AB1|nr:GDSL-type esterase/lipase family protein [Nonomuraea sp. SYSU D8015]